MLSADGASVVWDTTMQPGTCVPPTVAVLAHIGAVEVGGLAG